MKKGKRVVSLLLCLIMVIVAFPLSISAESSYGPKEVPKTYNYNEYLHTLQFLKDCLPNEKLLFETVENVDYIYTVKNGEATIINVHFQHYGPDKIVCAFPAELGGYPVTTIGDGENTVFWFIEYDEKIDWQDWDNYYDYTDNNAPNTRYISKYIIPEGYEHIAEGAFEDLGGNWVLPQSIKTIAHRSFSYVNSINATDAIAYFLPECIYEENVVGVFCPGYSLLSYSPVVSPSRSPKTAVDILYDSYGMPGSEYSTYAGTVYIPYNVTEKELEEAFYYFEAAAGYSGEYWPTYSRATVHCAPDCEWLSLFDKYTYESGFTYRDQVVTDVVPATSIAFDNETVYIAQGDYKDIAAKTYPAEALWTACDYVSSNPDVIEVDEYSGRITALKEGTATITATHCERGFTDSYNVVVLAEGAELPPDEPATEEPTTEEPTTEEPTTEEPTTEEPTTEEPTTEELTTEEPTTEEPPTGNDGESFFAQIWNFILRIYRFIVNTFKSIFGAE